MTYTTTDDLDAPIIEAPSNGKVDPAAFHTQLVAEVTEAKRELTRDTKTLEAARQKVADLTADVEFDQMRLDSREKGLATFDRLRAKANR